MNFPEQAVDAGEPAGGPLFSICTLVTNHADYSGMVESFVSHGFTPENSQFLYLDNTVNNVWDAFNGIRRFLEVATGKYIVVCHQDIRLLSDDYSLLVEKLAALEANDPNWALAGNAGATQDGFLAIRISDPHGEDQRRGSFPVRVESLDENLIIIRRNAMASLSAGLNGFHLYGTDICLQARCAGRTAWVIDFHLRHLSAGRLDIGFYQAQQNLELHYDNFLKTPWNIRTTCTKLILGGGGIRRWLARRRLNRLLLKGK
jgi:hypothetical protein